MAEELITHLASLGLGPTSSRYSRPRFHRGYCGSSRGTTPYTKRIRASWGSAPSPSTNQTPRPELSTAFSRGVLFPAAVIIFEIAALSQSFFETRISLSKLVNIVKFGAPVTCALRIKTGSCSTLSRCFRSPMSSGSRRFGRCDAPRPTDLSQSLAAEVTAEKEHQTCQ